MNNYKLKLIFKKYYKNAKESIETFKFLTEAHESQQANEGSTKAWYNVASKFPRVQSCKTVRSCMQMSDLCNH